MEIIENLAAWRDRFGTWQGTGSVRDDIDDSYPFVLNARSPFTAARCALPMLNLALISSAGVYIDGTEPFDMHARGGDLTFREIPREVEANDLKIAARGYDPTCMLEDLNAQVPINRLLEYEANGVIGQLNQTWWSFSGFIPDAAALVDKLAPELVQRVLRYEVQAALLIPASRLCHQSVGLLARAIEAAGVPTMILAVDRGVMEKVHAPRVGLYDGAFGSVAGQPGWPEYQLRILDEALRLIEPMDQPSIRRLSTDIETRIEQERGER